MQKNKIEQTEQLLKKMQILVDKLRNNSSTIEKKNVLKEHEDLKDLLIMICNKNYQLFITGDKILKHKHEGKFNNIQIDYDLFELFKLLNERTISGHYALNICASFFLLFSEYEEILVKIFNKNLRCGVSSKILESIFDEKLTFSVPLANKYNEYLVDFEKEDWFYSRKLDGIRCLAFIESDSIKFFSRTGKEFFTLDVLKEALSPIKVMDKYRNGVILDGEVCILNNNYDEDFNLIKKEIRKKNHTIKNPAFYVFDCYSIRDFRNKKDSLNFSEKLLLLKTIVNNARGSVYELSQFPVASKTFLENTFATIPDVWEGLMLRKNAPSQFKRSNNLLKIKKFQEAEYKVVAVHNSNKIINNVDVFCCNALEIKHKGNPVKIGSGLTDSQRIAWYAKPEKILGKIITVKYFEETKNEKGNFSLRFPVLKAVHGEKRND